MSQRAIRIERTLFLAVLAGLLLMAAASQKKYSIAVIDPDRLRRESRSVSAEMEKVAAPAREIMVTLQTKQEALTKALEDFGRQRTALSEDAIAKRSTELQLKSQEVQELSRQLKEKMDKAGAEGLSPMRQRVGQAVSELARERNIDLVLPASSVIFNTEELDLTATVITRLDWKK